MEALEIVGPGVLPLGVARRAAVVVEVDVRVPQLERATRRSDVDGPEARDAGAGLEPVVGAVERSARVVDVGVVVAGVEG